MWQHLSAWRAAASFRPVMNHVLTLIANRAATTLDAATIARVREATNGSEPDILSPGEAADILVAKPPDLDVVRAALEKKTHRRHRGQSPWPAQGPADRGYGFHHHHQRNPR